MLHRRPRPCPRQRAICNTQEHMSALCSSEGRTERSCVCVCVNAHTATVTRRWRMHRSHRHTGPRERARARVHRALTGEQRGRAARRRHARRHGAAEPGAGALPQRRPFGTPPQGTMRHPHALQRPDACRTHAPRWRVCSCILVFVLALRKFLLKLPLKEPSKAPYKVPSKRFI